MLKVLKFGGTSVGTLERIQNVANIIKKIKDDGHDVIAVVSAMSGETNKLIEYSEHFSKTPNKCEMDMLLSSGERVTSALLSIALNEQGYEAISMSGRQAGIVTDDAHTKARIEGIDTTSMKKAISDGKVVVVAGFQGVTEEGRVTTLGRGGSDLTAVAIAGAINADVCEIYTDVDGIYTTDPRIEPKAKKLDKISYDEMLELASLGAKVLQNRSVEMAKKLNVNLVSRSSFTPEIEGTLITKEENIMEKPIVSGIALDRNQIRVGLYGLTDRPGIAASIFTSLADENINVDMIVQTKGTDGKTNLDFTIPTTDFESCKKVMSKFDNDDSTKIDYSDEICKVSIVGVGMKSHTGVASKAFATLAKENINIRIISTSEIKISMIILEKYAELAVRALHDAYNLDK
ncbi:aspartate kinase [Malaciobacter molluscorum LMG 25693]|uniref:Aspartokinase n=1 Tax=Malaciobacter molluscorum LMG 25693 TaxID=870501 RepID=A0A2G1DI00_9BACT|nr:aspartate kinase [Malaciobacter molluscorum]AXX92422.1 aspartokinase, alpha and beta subunits [Malaciobacter molluscorum LMG 25693]PHO18132.1 aspartate kinase [Malaciobacter molluscorum LMG 25693]RXJ93921.1 aspartate kinase [Malaciobacter molluscorum]